MTKKSLPEPLGFPQCDRCPYRNNGTPAICAACAAGSLQPLAADHCSVCSQVLSGPDAECRNPICSWPIGQRYFTRADAIAMYAGVLGTAVHRYKYQGKTGWAIIFGRLIVGWLDSHADDVRDIDLIIGNPTAPDRQPRHIELIMRAAIKENTTSQWPLASPADPVMIKRWGTSSSAGLNVSWQAKWEAAREHVAALQLRADVTTKRILLVDDIFTTGAQVSLVAKFLKQHGAAEVRALVLGRVPFKR